MSLRHRRRNGDQRYNEWRRNCQWNRRLKLRSSFDDKDDINSHRLLLPRNVNNNYYHMQSNNDKTTYVLPDKEGQQKWRNVALNLVSKSIGNIKSELVNVVTSNIVEFAVAVVTAYASNWVFG